MPACYPYASGPGSSKPVGRPGTFGAIQRHARHHARIHPVETASRPVVGFAEDYPAGLRTGLHSHPRAQVLYAVSGVMRIATEAMTIVVPPSAALLLPAGMPHDITMEGAVRMRALFLRQAAAARLGERTAVLAVTPLLRELILAACAEPLDWALNGRGHHIAALALDEIARCETLPLALPIPRDARLRRVTEALSQHPASARSLDDWAETAGATSRTLARLFRAELGVSFRQWRLQARLAEALGALTAGATPTQAAALAGFRSVPAFGAAFLKLFGMTPGQARTRFTNAPATR